MSKNIDASIFPSRIDPAVKIKACNFLKFKNFLSFLCCFHEKGKKNCKTFKEIRIDIQYVMK